MNNINPSDILRELEAAEKRMKEMEKKSKGAERKKEEKNDNKM